VLEPVLGESYSAQTISNITRQLHQAVAHFHRRPLRDDYVYLFLDGVVLKVRDLAAKVRRRMVLVAYGVLPNGKRQILAYQFAHGESEAAWLEFLQDLFLRGLAGKNLRLIVSDGGKGLRAALPVVYPRIPSNSAGLTKCAPRRQSPPPGRFLRRPSLRHLSRQQQKASQRAFQEWKRHWEHHRPRAVACVERDLENLLRLFRCSGNALAQGAHHQRHRTRLPGGPPPHPSMSSFSNTESCDRIIYGVISH